jgi:putative hydrolase of the HAD superfamily
LGGIRASALMVQAVIFDLFETLITESRTQPAGVSSLAPSFGCEREAFQTHWKALRPAVTVGRVSFRQALSDIAARLGGHADEVILQRLCDERTRAKAEPFAQVEHEVLMIVDYLRSRNLRLGIISNCFAEDVAAWPQCSLASCFDCTVFSSEVGLAKPDPQIYVEATRRLRVDPAEAWFIGDGGQDELSGAMQAGLRAFRALWFLRRWRHFREEPCSAASVATFEEVVSLVEQAIGPPDDALRRPLLA